MECTAEACPTLLRVLPKLEHLEEVSLDVTEAESRQLALALLGVPKLKTLSTPDEEYEMPTVRRDFII